MSFLGTRSGQGEKKSGGIQGFCHNGSAHKPKGAAAKTNLLKRQMDCICKEYLAGIFPAVGKCARGALETLFGGIVAGKSTLVTDLARPLRRDSSAKEAKRANERVSGWLGRWDFVSALNPWLLGKAREEASDEATFALDFSDISKEFGGEGMEGMAKGWDGSRGVTAMGHDFVCVSLVGGGRREARTVYARLAKGRKSKGALHAEALSAVMEATGGRGWTAEDRGMDAAEHIVAVKRKGWKAVIRVKEMDRDVFGDGLPIDRSLAKAPFVPATLRTHGGTRNTQLRWRPGAVMWCDKPHSKDAKAETARVLVVESRFDGKSIWLYAVCPDAALDGPGSQERIARRAAQAYHDRWQIETSFQTVKQEFGLEKARVRTFKRLENLFALCNLAYVFATDYLRRTPGFRKVLQLLSDNLETVSTKTHALLAGIRALVGVPKVRFISGRPRKVHPPDPLQMLLAY